MAACEEDDIFANPDLFEFCADKKTEKSNAACKNENNEENSEDYLPIFKVIFKDQEVSRNYYHQVSQFLNNILHVDNQSKSKPAGSEHDLPLELNVWEGFSIDVASKPETSTDYGWTVPKYEKTVSDALHEEVQSSELKRKVPQKPMCFNCLGDHMLQDCSEPRDGMKISKNRAEFRAKNPISSRYHVNDDQRFAHIQPGQYSSKLLHALGLTFRHLPPFVYGMRVLGYPAGWLEEAIIEHSGITLFDSGGEKVADPMEEEGELEASPKIQYNIKKLKGFPGFNIPPCPGTIDEHLRYNAPPMLAHQALTIMESQMRPNQMKAYKRKKQSKIDAPKGSGSRAETDMEVEDIEDITIQMGQNGDECTFIPPLPMNALPEKPPLPPEDPPESGNGGGRQRNWSTEVEVGSMSQSGSTSKSSSQPGSPSLSDLLEKKDSIMEELKEKLSSVPDDDACSQDSVFSSAGNTPSGSGRNTPANVGPPHSSSNSTPAVSGRSTPVRTKRKHMRMRSKLLHHGTPIPSQYSPYTKIPETSNFAVDTTEHIPFENLPDSTGKYSQMADMLKKVREKVLKIQQHEDD